MYILLKSLHFVRNLYLHLTPTCAKDHVFFHLGMFNFPSIGTLVEFVMFFYFFLFFYFFEFVHLKSHNFVGCLSLYLTFYWDKDHFFPSGFILLVTLLTCFSSLAVMHLGLVSLCDFVKGVCYFLSFLDSLRKFYSKAFFSLEEKRMIFFHFCLSSLVLFVSPIFVFHLLAVFW